VLTLRITGVPGRPRIESAGAAAGRVLCRHAA
jgi:hypothetical protein